jgi:hypothetical protein
MSPLAVSRRAALTRILKAGTGMLALGAVGYAAARAAANEGAPPIRNTPVYTPPPKSPAPADLVNGLPPTEFAPTATPEPRDLRLHLIPTELRIPSLDIDAPVGPAETAPGSGGRELLVPNSGLVSPNHLIGDMAINNVWILGHSRWHRVPQLLYTLADLDAGDRIAVAAHDPTSGRSLPTLSFEVDRLILADTELAGREIYAPTPDRPRLIIQTSVRQAYDPEWILDRPTLEAKADVAVTTSVDDLAKYLLLLVTAELSDDTFASLLANA